MIKNDKTNIDEKYKRFEKIHDKIKFKAFEKVTIRQRRIPKDKLEVVGKDTATELLEAQQKRAQSKIEDIEKTKGGKVRKTDVEATAIINPKTGNLALSKGEIKKVSLQYTKETLMSNPIEEGVAEEIEQKKVATRKFLKESGGTFEINKEIFEKVLAKFKGSIKRNYDIIVRSGPASCRTGKCCNSKFSHTAVRWDTNICDSKHSICKSDDSKHSMLWHLWQQSKKSQYTCPKNMTGSFQNGRTSSKMWGPAFNIVSLPKIACKIVRPFKPDFRERWQVSEFSVSSRKTRSDQGNSRSRLDA